VQVSQGLRVVDGVQVLFKGAQFVQTRNKKKNKEPNLNNKTIKLVSIEHLNLEWRELLIVP